MSSDAQQQDRRGERGPRGDRLATAATRCKQLLLIAAVVYVGWRVVLALGAVLAPLAVAILLTTLLLPIRQKLVAWGAPRLVAVLVPMFILIVVPSGALFLAGSSLDLQVRGLGNDLSSGVQAVRDWVAQHHSVLGFDIADQLDRLRTELEHSMSLSAAQVASGAAGLLRIVIGLLMVVVFCFFVLLDGPELIGSGMERLRPARRGHIVDVAGRVWERLSGYMRGLALVALADSVLFGIALLIIGLPSVVPIMIITFIAAFIPFAGPVTATAVAVLIALGTGGLLKALLVVGAGILTQAVEGNALQPFAFGHSIELRPLVIFTAIVAGTTLAGPVGTFLAVPVTALLVVVRDELTKHEDGEDGDSGGESLDDDGS